MIEDFQDILFPPNLGFSASKTIERQVEVQDFLSGIERRNSRKYNSKRKYNIGVAAKLFEELAQITDFFEARRGSLVGFKWHDILDYKSCPVEDEVDAFDQKIGVFDGSSLEFQLAKTYGQCVDEQQNYIRKISRPIGDTVKVAVDGVELDTAFYWVEPLTGLLTIYPSAGLTIDDEVTAGFEFYVPVRFADLQLKIDYTAFKAGEIAQIPIIEILE